MIITTVIIYFLCEIKRYIVNKWERIDNNISNNFLCEKKSKCGMHS